jgi:hypothetical protein
VADITRESYKSRVEQNRLERLAIDGKSPVCELRRDSLDLLPSKAGPVKSRLNLRGPPRKAEYYSMTDSGPVP